MKRVFITFALALICAFLLISCGKVDFKVNFVVDGEVYSTVSTGGNETVKMPENPTKEGYNFDGWYWDKDVWQKPFTANSLLDAPLSSDMNVYAKFKSNHAHEYTEQITKQPTCTEKGEKTFTCSCGESYTEDIPAKGHSYVEKTIAPTCEDQGYTLYTCNDCGNSYKDNYKAETGHKFTAYVSDNNATYEKDGTKTAYCDYGCGKTDTVTDAGSRLVKDEITFKTLTVNDNEVYGKVPNATTNYNFLQEVETKGKAKYTVSKDREGSNVIVSKNVNLNLGDNQYYITVTVDGEPIELYSVIIRRRLIYTVSFSTNGGTSVASQRIEEDSLATEPTTERAGYNFNGWDYDFNEPVTSSLTVKASWTANTDTPYKVEYYLENLDDNNYTLTETVNKAGTTDTQASAEIKTYEHFTPTSGTVSGNINGNGSTILKVYYTRNNYTFSATNENTKGGSINCTEGGTYKYEKQINLSATVNAGYDFVGWFKGESKISEELNYSFKLSENSNITAKYSARTDTPYKVEYYLENLEDDNYTLTETANKAGTTDTQASAEIKTYEHFTPTSGTVSGNIHGDGSTVLKVYYKLERFTVNISASNSNIVLNTTYNGSYKYGYLLKLQVSVNLGYEFNGWYSDDELITYATNPTFILDNDLSLIATCAVKEEMQNFAFTSTVATCQITGIKDKTVTEIIVPDYVTSINCGAFSGCSSLENITLPFIGAKAGVTANDTYQYPFGYIFGTSSYTGGTSTTQYDYGSNTSLTANSYYYIPSSLKSVTVTGGNILYGAFYNCSGLTSITIPDSVTSIGEWAFSGCSGLTSVTIPDGVTSIGSSAFSGCVNLQYYEYNNGYYLGNENNKYVALIKAKDTSITSCNINKNTKLISYAAFEGCSGLTSVTIPDGVTSIGNFAFAACGLTSITIPDGVTSIGEHAFDSCSGLTSVTIPDSVISIGRGAFVDCSGLTSITIPDSVTSIGLSAFEGCSGLTSITIPDGVTSIRDDAFYNCSGLTSITIPDGVTSIGDAAFYNCSGLTSVTIGNGVTSIGSGVFSGCDNLQYYEYNNGYYLGNENNKYVALIKAKDTSITSCNINENTKLISFDAFSGCSGLTSITIPDGVTSIGERAFYNCSGLTSITIPDSVTSIGQSVFYGCSGLMSITIPDSVTSIGSYAFSNCTGLTSITIPDGVTSIGNRAFEYCSALTRITFKGTKAQWQAISKGSNWKVNVPTSWKVYCTDGTISI